MASMGLKAKSAKIKNVNVSRYGNIQVIDEKAFIKAVLAQKNKNKQENQKNK